MDAPDGPGEWRAGPLRHLVRREPSRAELPPNPAQHAESPEALAAVLDLLLSNNHQSDERFAEERARVLSRKYGAARIRHDLRSKGISDEISESVGSDSTELAKPRPILQAKYRKPRTTWQARVN